MLTQEFDSNEGRRLIVSGQIVSNLMIEIGDVVTVKKNGEEMLLRVLEISGNSAKVIEKDEKDNGLFFEIDFEKIFGILKLKDD
jgi:hypothetical protein